MYLTKSQLEVTDTHKYSKKYYVRREISSHIWAACQCNKAHKGYNADIQTTKQLKWNYDVNIPDI